MRTLLLALLLLLSCRSAQALPISGSALLDQQKRIVARWEEGRFIFNGPRGKKFLASSGRLNSESFGRLNSETISGKLFRIRKGSRAKRIRSADKRRHGSFVISKIAGPTGANIVADFQIPNGESYSLVGAASGELKLTDRRQAALPACGDAEIHETRRADALPAGGPGIRSTPTIRVLFVYTDAALREAGSVLNLAGYVNVGVANAREAWANSGVDGNIVIAGMEAIGGPDETGDYHVDLNHITDFDGIWDNVHSLRTDYGADVVSLMMASGQYCGLGWTSAAVSSLLFHAFKYDCTRAFRHELGHNLGAAHDRENTVGAPIYPYGYGWRFFGNSSEQFATLMSYAPGTSIDYASNPNIFFDGQPTGVNNWADNVRVWNDTLPTAAAALGAPLISPTPFPSVTPTPAPGLLSLSVVRNRRRAAIVEATVADGSGPYPGVTVDFGVRTGPTSITLIGESTTNAEGKATFRVFKTSRRQLVLGLTAIEISNEVRVRRRR